MRHYFILSLALVFCLLALAPRVSAQSVPNLSDQKLQQIRENCVADQSILQRLQASDVATRVSRGQVYASLLSNLIGPFNSRVSLNRYDASELTAETAQLQKDFNNFKSDYSQYATNFSAMLSVKCESKPADFYDDLQTTRELRAKLASDVSALDQHFNDYSAAFERLAGSITGVQQ